METSALDATNVDNAFSEVLTQVLSNCEQEDSGGSRGDTINVKGDVPALKRAGC